MLADQLPPLPWAIEQNLEFTGECLALVILAGDNNVAIQPRVMESLTKAYAMGNVLLTPFVPNGKPGYAVAYWDSPETRRVTVAIEGMRSYSQLRNFWQGYAVAPWMFGGGHIYGQVAQLALQIRDELLANGAFNGFWNLPGTCFTFTGHSLGAMIAELLGEMFKNLKPGKNIKVVKFGSPRIGSTRYVNERNRNVIRESWYYDRDPIDVLPYFATSSNVIDLLPLTGGPGTWLQRDPDAYRAGWDAGGVEPFHVGGMVQAAYFLQKFYQPADRTNPFWDHSINSYRYMMTVVSDFNSGLLRWRFRYLEFNNENQWGAAYVHQQTYNDSMLALNVPGPAPVVVDPADMPELGIGGGGDDDVVIERSRREIGNFDNPIITQRVDPSPVQPEVARVPAIVAPAPSGFSGITPNRRRSGRWSAAQGR